MDFTTPKIDEVLERFRIHRQDRFTRPTREEVYGSEQESETHQVTERLGLLEKQIDSLVKMQMQRQVNYSLFGVADILSPKEARRGILCSLTHKYNEAIKLLK